MEHLDELSLGVRGQIMGKDMDHPPVVSPIMANLATPLSNTLWALFDVPQEAFVYLRPTVRWEPNPASSEFTSHSRDLPLGAPLRAVLLTSALRLYVQMWHHLNREPDFAANFCLPSPAS